MERVLRNTAATIYVTFYNGTTAVDADTNPAVVVKKANGTTLVSTTATNEPGTGVYSVVIPPQATLNLLTATWTGLFTGTSVSIVSEVEIVGGFYFSISELRNYDSALANVTKYPTEALVNARTMVEAEFEDICGRAFVQRYYREEALVRDTDTSLLWTEKPEVQNILSLSVNGVDQTAWATAGLFKKDKYSANSLIPSGVALSSIYALDVTAEYEYGMKRVPLLIKQKALKRAKMILVGMNSTIDERALTMNLPDIGSVNLATPGLRGSETGVPDIDVVLNRYKLDGGAGVF